MKKPWTDEKKEKAIEEYHAKRIKRVRDRMNELAWNWLVLGKANKLAND